MQEIDREISCETPRKGQEVCDTHAAQRFSIWLTNMSSFPKDDKKKPPHLTAALGMQLWSL